jgi:sucrose-6-phosphate hydrolase SacC (GH32 family)
MQGDRPETVPVWEMPQFWQLTDDRWMLIVNAWEAGRENPYWIGQWEDETFTPEKRGIFALGEHFLSPTGGYGPDGRLMVFGITAGPRDPAVDHRAGWAHAAALPRRVWWREDNKLGIKPAPALKKLRHQPRHAEAIALEPGGLHRLDRIKGDRLELKVTLDPQEAERVGVVVRHSPDGQEQTRIYYDRSQQRLAIDRSQSSLNNIARRSSQRGGESELGVLGGPITLNDDGHIVLHLFIDQGLIEGFVNQHRCFATWVYPERSDSTGVSLFAKGDKAEAVSVKAWTMQSIWSQ